MAKEVYWRNTQGTDLYATVFAPDNTRRTLVGVVHPGGWKAGNAGPTGIASAMAESGFVGVALEYPLAPPGGVTGPMSTRANPPHPVPAQDTVGDNGYYPEPHLAIAQFIVWARNHPNGNGKVWLVGGSAGASLALFFWARGLAADDGLLHNGWASGVVGNTLPDGCVCFSIGVSNNADVYMWGIADPGDETDPASAVANHLNIPNTRPNPPSGANLTLAQNSSAIHWMPAASGARPPLYILCAEGIGGFGGDSIGIPNSTGLNIAAAHATRPYTQYEVEPGTTGALPALIANGYTESASAVPVGGTYKLTRVGVPDHRHAFEYASMGPDDPVVSNPPDVLRTLVLPFMQATAGDPGPIPSLPEGVMAFISNEKPIDQAILDNTDIAGVTVAVAAATFNPTKGNNNYNYLTSALTAVAASAGYRAADGTIVPKKLLIRISTSKGSATNKGNAPDWWFTEMGKALGGRGRHFDEGTSSTGSATVTSPHAQFTSADLHGRIVFDGSATVFYVGIVNSGLSIGLSSSQTANTPVNAPVTGTGTVAFHLLDRATTNQFDDGAGSASSTTFTSETAAFSHFDDGKPIQGPTDTIAAGTTMTYVSATQVTLSAALLKAASGLKFYLPARAGVAYDAAPRSVNPGFTYAVKIKGDKEFIVPVFFQKTFLDLKKACFDQLGEHLATLPANQQGSVCVIGASCYGINTDDFGLAQDDKIDAGYCLSQLDAWRNATTATPFPGAGYTTQKAIDAMIGVKAVDSFTDGTISTANTHIQSATAGFVESDVNSVVTGPGIDHTPPNKIVSVTDLTHADLAFAPTQSISGTAAFTIRDRKTGLVDAIAAALPDQLITQAVAPADGVLDADYATLHNDSDPENALCRAEVALCEETYPGRIIVQQNSANAVMQVFPATGNQWQLTGEIKTEGFLTAAQMVWFTFGDPNFRANGGVPGDPGAVLLKSAQNVATFDASYLEVYAVDCVNLLSTIGAIRLLLDPLSSGGGGPPPPPPGSLPPATLVYPSVNYLKAVLYGIAARLGIATSRGVGPDRAQRWAVMGQTHLDDAWAFFPWPQLSIVEERAFRQIYSVRFDYVSGEEVFYIGDADLVGRGYYRALVDAPAGTLPTDTSAFETFNLVAGDFYLPEHQDCRRRIGEIMEVYTGNPIVPIDDYPNVPTLFFRASGRGIEIVPPAGQTVFIRYKIPPLQFTAIPYDGATGYVADDLMLWTDGDVYRALGSVSGTGPDTAPSSWARVPFPAIFRDYVVLMVASEEAPDATNAAKFAGMARRALQTQADRYMGGQGVGPASWGRRSAIGYNAYAYAMPQLEQGTTANNSAANTISDVCVNEWGDVIG